MRRIRGRIVIVVYRRLRAVCAIKVMRIGYGSVGVIEVGMLE